MNDEPFWNIDIRPIMNVQLKHLSVAVIVLIGAWRTIGCPYAAEAQDLVNDARSGAAKTATVQLAAPQEFPLQNAEPRILPPQKTTFVPESDTLFAAPPLAAVKQVAYQADDDDQSKPAPPTPPGTAAVDDAVMTGDIPPDGIEPLSYPYVYTTGTPFPGDGAFFHFPEDPPPLDQRFVERFPTALTWPNEPLGNFFAKILHAERYELETDLHDEPLGIQPVPDRPPLIVEWNERFLGPGELAPGTRIPTGAIWRPAFWVFGEFRTAAQHFDNGGGAPISEWANRLDLFGQLNLSGTERIVYGVRPFDKEIGAGTARRFVGYDFNTGNGLDGGNWDTQTAYFEGDIGEIFPFLDPYDYKLFDYGFSVGRMPLLAQQGLLINEDRIDAVTLTRNTLNGWGNLNLRMTGVYAWDQVTRNSPILPASIQNERDNNSYMIALLTESDFFKRTVNADFVYVDGDAAHGDMFAFGLSAIRRHYWHENTYNTSFHVLGSFPINGETPYNQQGELLFAQISWTPHHYLDLIYLNAFLAIDQFTSPARGPLMGSPLGQTGILLASVALGRYGPPIGAQTNNLAGGSLGYQWFFDGTRKQLIWEIGGFGETDGGPNRAAVATGLRYQQAVGQHYILVFDGFVSKRENFPQPGVGGRAELRVKF